MADRGDHDRRSRRSRCPIRVITMADPRDHVPPIPAIMFGRRAHFTPRALASSATEISLFSRSISVLGIRPIAPLLQNGRKAESAPFSSTRGHVRLIQVYCYKD